MRFYKLTSFAVILLACNNRADIKPLPAYPDSALTHVKLLPTSIFIDTLHSGDIIDSCFYIKNVGTNDYYLSSIKPSCSCTSLHYAAHRIAPKDSLKVSFTFKAEKATHAYFGTIMIYGNTKPVYRQFSIESYVK